MSLLLIVIVLVLLFGGVGGGYYGYRGGQYGFGGFSAIGLIVLLTGCPPRPGIGRLPPGSGRCRDTPNRNPAPA